MSKGLRLWALLAAAVVLGVCVVGIVLVDASLGLGRVAVLFLAAGAVVCAALVVLAIAASPRSR